MNIVIIEDELVVAEDLEFNIRQLSDEPVNIVQLHSVKASIAYFKTHTGTDLILSDIQLGDGLSFEIFFAVPMATPVIFCTAFDEYALEAFRANGIDYILKPFSEDTLERALSRYKQLKMALVQDQNPQFHALMQLLTEREAQKAVSILVYHQDKIIPVKMEDIALFYLENEVTHLLTFTGKTFYPNKNMEELERIIGSNFFRANRQFLVCRKTVIDVSSFFSRKLALNLSIHFNDKVIVSKGKAAQFLKWLAMG